MSSILQLMIATIIACILVDYARSNNYSFAQRTKLNYTDCGSRSIRIERFDVSPMPIIQPGEIQLSFAAILETDIKGVVKFDLKIIRTVSGIKLPIKCYTVNGRNIGSCSYADLCYSIKDFWLFLAHDDDDSYQFDPANCPAQLAQYGIDCTCPLRIPAQYIDIDIPVRIPVPPPLMQFLGAYEVIQPKPTTTTTTTTTLPTCIMPDANVIG
ncbi:unnamed protein product [Didymodactylos carnosus]|uniref:MD-2-related lipid-recognition domain-containing protein n=1 Tax=Didymodactylos carnosus TaxID=1234261 RepID=A0A8S2JJA3_9BILA|nr:unnamed protein product [Didymodactylos carnosus]CAF3801780.1 unnamed protein product [Didymodactylos carnosus]